MRALRAVPGLRLDVLDAGCCGMSGVFGYESEHYDLSVGMAERVLLPAVRSVPPGAAVLATGTSCRTQIRDLAGRRAAHPLEFLAQCVDVGPDTAQRRSTGAVPREVPWAG
jgi:Fe-S oxidoreductase